MLQFQHFFSVDSAKAVKAQEYGWLNAINYMAPAATGGYGNLCPHASAGCKALCLGEHSGQAAMVSRLTGDNSVRASRRRKVSYFMTDRSAFLCEAATHIARNYRKASVDGMRLAVRLNGATDIAWEGVRFAVSRDMMLRLANIMWPRSDAHDWYMSGEAGQHTLYSLFPHVQFVDYTKNPFRFGRTLPENLDLTFSRSETNEASCLNLLAQGVNVAVVFRRVLPATWKGFPVIDGDSHDLRHLDSKGGFVVGLLPKGNKAKRDTSGFVVD